MIKLQHIKQQYILIAIDSVIVVLGSWFECKHVLQSLKFLANFNAPQIRSFELIETTFVPGTLFPTKACSGGARSRRVARIPLIFLEICSQPTPATWHSVLLKTWWHNPLGSDRLALACKMLTVASSEQAAKSGYFPGWNLGTSSGSCWSLTVGEKTSESPKRILQGTGRFCRWTTSNPGWLVKTYLKTKRSLQFCQIRTLVSWFVCGSFLIVSPFNAFVISHTGTWNEIFCLLPTLCFREASRNAPLCHDIAASWMDSSSHSSFSLCGSMLVS